MLMALQLSFASENVLFITHKEATQSANLLDGFSPLQMLIWIHIHLFYEEKGNYL